MQEPSIKTSKACEYKFQYTFTTYTDLDIKPSQQILITVEQDLKVPLTIFSNKKPFQTLTKWLYDQGLSTTIIARLLNRSQQAVWLSISKARKQESLGNSKTSKTDLQIPISVFQDRDLSIMEHLVLYLSNKGFSQSQIASMLDRSLKTIWTWKSRALKKLQAKNLQVKKWRR